LRIGKHFLRMEALNISCMPLPTYIPTLHTLVCNIFQFLNVWAQQLHNFLHIENKRTLKLNSFWVNFEQKLIDSSKWSILGATSFFITS
jgi:hypothetical protein